MGQITEDIRQLEQDSEDAQGNGVFLLHAFKSTSVISCSLAITFLLFMYLSKHKEKDIPAHLGI